MTHKGFKHWIWKCTKCPATGKKPVAHTAAIYNGRMHMKTCHQVDELPEIIKVKGEANVKKSSA